MISSSKLLPALLLVLAAGCIDSESPTGGESKADLPNGSLYERDHDGEGYKRIAEFYATEGFDLAVDQSKLAPTWPLTQSGTALLDRFGTPIQLNSYAYFHTALDVSRRTVRESPRVHAPVSGQARVFDWSGEPGYHGRDYQAVVAIWDSESHAIVELMHVRPIRQLMTAGDVVEVRQGDVIGTLANDLDFLGDESQQLLRHTHASIIDGEKMVALNPARHFDYHDHEAPTVNDLYVLDEDANKSGALVTGKLDVVLDLFDRDDDSERNFEVGSIAYEIYDDQNRLLSESSRCNFDDLYSPLSITTYKLGALNLIDFGNARAQKLGGWPNSDIDNRERTFRYALTQLNVDSEGRCGVLDDAAGFLEVPDTVASIEIRAQIWDHNDNRTEFVQKLER